MCVLGKQDFSLTQQYRWFSETISVWYNNATNQDCKALQRVVRLAERISGSALPSLQHIYLKRCKSRAAKILKDSTHPSNHLFCLLPSGKRFRSMMAKTERLRRSFFPQAIRLLTQTLFHKHLQDPLLTVNILTFSSLLLYVQYPEQPVCTSLLFTLLFIKSQYTVFLFCTSYCFLHILLFFAHLIVLHFFISLHILLLFLFFTICMPLCCVTLYNLYSYYFALSTERTWFDYISLLIIPCITYYVTNKETLTLTLETK